MAMTTFRLEGGPLDGREQVTVEDCETIRIPVPTPHPRSLVVEAIGPDTIKPPFGGYPPTWEDHLYRREPGRPGVLAYAGRVGSDRP